MNDQYRVCCTACGWTDRTFSVEGAEQAKRLHLRRWHHDAPHGGGRRDSVAFTVDVLTEAAAEETARRITG